MDRRVRFSASGAHLLWRVKNAARSVPFRLLRTLPDGSELVLLRESGNMLGKRRRDAGDKTLPRLPGTVARLVCFTVLTRTRRGGTKTAAIRVLTTLLDHEAYPARDIAVLYAERWQVETAFLHLKKTVRGVGGDVLEGGPALGQQGEPSLVTVVQVAEQCVPGAVVNVEFLVPGGVLEGDEDSDPGALIAAVGEGRHSQAGGAVEGGEGVPAGGRFR
jgi:hypothetical protein